MIHVICRLTAKNRDQLWNPMLGNKYGLTFLNVHCTVGIRCIQATILHTNTHTRLTALCPGLPGEPVPER